METWQAVTVALAALLVGALLPAALLLAMALRSWRATAVRAEGALVAVTATAQRLDRFTARLEAGDQVERLLRAFDGVAVAAGQVEDLARLVSAAGAAGGAAIGAAVRAWRASRDGAAPTASSP